jgi:hypothetical protein
MGYPLLSPNEEGFGVCAQSPSMEYEAIAFWEILLLL